MFLTIILFFGSVREGRNCLRIGNFIKNQLEQKKHNVIVYDPLVIDFPMLKKPLHFYGPGEKPPSWLVQGNCEIETADGYVVVSAEYNGCIPPALTNMLSHFPPASYRCKPCSIVSYSSELGGGSTAGKQLRYFLGELGMVTPGFIFSNPIVHEAYTEEGTPYPSNANAFTNAEVLISELEWYANALKSQKEKCGLP